MILRGQLRGKVGRRRDNFYEEPLSNQRLFAFSPQRKTRFPGQGKRDIAHERGGWVAAKIHIAATAGNLSPFVHYVTTILERQRTFVPAGTLGSTFTRLGSPSIEAASTIPFDSTPISVA